MSLVKNLEEKVVSSLNLPSDLELLKAEPLLESGLISAEQIVRWYYWDKLKLAWWVKMTTTTPLCIYYFGPFGSAKEAELAQSGYIEDLEQEGVEGITVQIQQCQPKELTLFEDNYEANLECEVLPPLCCQVLNQALPVVIEEIENALEAYPDEACRQFFTQPERYHQLIAYVLSKIPTVYTVFELLQKAAIKPKFPALSLELRLRLESYIYWGIQQIFQDNYNGVIN